MFEAASFADASFSPKNRCEAGGCKVISHKENTIWIVSWGCEASTWKNDKRKKTITRGNTIWLTSGFLDSPMIPCVQSSGPRWADALGFAWKKQRKRSTSRWELWFGMLHFPCVGLYWSFCNLIGLYNQFAPTFGFCIGGRRLEYRATTTWRS